jgi:ribosomal protein S18 acetylase RimI-like enzyme
MTLSPSLHIRPARTDDLPAIGRLGAALVRHHHSLDPRRFFLAEDLEEGYESFLGGELGRKRSVLIVAEARDEQGAGQVVGYAWGRLDGRDWDNLLDTAGKLHDVYVDPSARALGAGRALCEEMIQRLSALGAPRIVLSTAWGNASAQRLFESLGFRRTMIEMMRERGP